MVRPYLKIKRSILIIYKRPLCGSESNGDSRRHPVIAWSKVLQDAGFVGVEADAYDGRAPFHLHRTIISRIPSEEFVKGSIIYLLCPSQRPSNSWIEEVQGILIQSGYIVKRFVIGEPIPRKQYVISLLDLGGPFFHNISKTNWESFQAFLSTSPQILWLTKSVELSCSDPNFSIVMGVSRTARQEQELRFGTLQVDIFDAVAVEGLLKVCEKFFKSTEQSGLTDVDYEFALRDGLIYIPRMQWTSIEDKTLGSSSTDSSYAKLTMNSYGTIDSIFWGEDEPNSLGEDEVEVDVKFVGLNFRVRWQNAPCPSG